MKEPEQAWVRCPGERLKGFSDSLSEIFAWHQRKFRLEEMTLSVTGSPVAGRQTPDLLYEKGALWH
jgi:hypothetical protein